MGQLGIGAMIVLEEWEQEGFHERLVGLPDGSIKAEWKGPYTGRWMPWEDDDCYHPLPLFAPTRKTRPTARAKSRPRRTRS